MTQSRIDNAGIAEIFEEMAFFMEVLGENSFKARGYSQAADTIEKTGARLADMAQPELEAALGKSFAAKVKQLLLPEGLKEYEELKANIPALVRQLKEVNGLGPKKVRSLWLDHQIDSLEKVLEACGSGQLATFSGFGEKTQASIASSVVFVLDNAKKLRINKAWALYEFWKQTLSTAFPEVKLEPGGELRRHANTVTQTDLVVSDDFQNEVEAFLSEHELLLYLPKNSGPFVWKSLWDKTPHIIAFHFVDAAKFWKHWLVNTGSTAHLGWKFDNETSIEQAAKKSKAASEKAFYEELHLPFIPPELREGLAEVNLDAQGIDSILTYEQLKGPLHNHSRWSDGVNTLQEMALFCVEKGWEYFGIADHSQTATYASGLEPHRVLAQHLEIENLNIELAPFKILKGIESDILGDGSLDYENDLLSKFDYVVASVHSTLNMNEATATQRLIKAVENPFTTILGHPTGRLLLKREGYPLNMPKLLDACAANRVAIEINASPWRLDLDWHWVNAAIEKGIMIAINPDAHKKEALTEMKYGVMAGRKAGLKTSQTLNALPLGELMNWMKNRIQLL